MKIEKYEDHLRPNKPLFYTKYFLLKMYITITKDKEVDLDIEKR